MKKTDDEVENKIILFSKKLPLVKKEELLDYVKWLWLSVGKGEKQNVKTAIAGMRELQANHPAYKGWDSVKEIRKWRNIR